MSPQAGAALAISLVLLMLLSLLALSGARLGAADLRIALAEEQRLAALEQAQSAIDEALQRACVANCGAGLEVTRPAIPALPPPAGTGYSADRLLIDRLRYASAPDGVTQVVENVGVLRAANAPGLALDADCGRVDPPAVSFTLDDGRAASITVHGSEIVASDETDAAHPAELWRLAPAGDFAQLAPAWSAPRVARVLLDEAPATVVLLGAGYGEGRGAAIYGVRADTGALIWRGTHPQLRAGIAAGLALLDSNADGFVDRIIGADTGGVLWRADLGGAPSVWTLTLLARLGGRFFATPDIVQERDSLGRYDAVIAGSGDAEYPRAAAADFLYLVRDRNIGIGAGADHPDSYEGWRIALEPGEKILSAPLVIAHSVHFATWMAGAAATCGSGHGQLNAAALASGALRPPGPALAGLPQPLAYAGPAGGSTACVLNLIAGTLRFEVAGCSRFRGAWARAGS